MLVNWWAYTWGLIFGGPYIRRGLYSGAYIRRFTVAPKGAFIISRKAKGWYRKEFPARKCLLTCPNFERNMLPQNK